MKADEIIVYFHRGIMVTLTYQAGGYKETVLCNVPRPLALWRIRELKKTTHKLGTFKINKV